MLTVIVTSTSFFDFSFLKLEFLVLRIILPNGTTKTEQKTLTEKIRHQIHHPENCHNEPYTETEIRQSIEDMRAFIMRK